MNKIIILVGEHISDLYLQCGGAATQGLFFDTYGAVKWIHGTESTSRACPEEGKHPRIYKEWLVKDVSYALAHWNYIITTNSSNTIDILCRLVYVGIIQPEQLIIHGLDSQNKEIIFTSTLDSDKCYLLNWPYGFMDIG